MENNNAHTALLVMDMQAALLQSLTNADRVKASVAKAIAFARDNKIPVIFCVLSLREGFPEVSNNNKSFAAAKSRL